MKINVLKGASALALALFFFGCSSHTYQGDKLKESIQKICKEEYDIQHVDVKVVDTTIGVYLPLKKLFSADFKNALVSGKVKDMSSLLEPSPEAIEKVEDVLFAISRVLLSTERKIEFYELQAVDVEKSGMSIYLVGAVDDIRRVRIWDISRDEYRRRIIHDFRPNRTARWHQPVRQFFDDLSRLPLEEVKKAYFGKDLPTESLRSLFFYQVQGAGQKENPHWDVISMRSVPIQKNRVLVYAKVRSMDAPQDPRYPKDLEYLFWLGISDDKVVILRIIPYQYLDAQGAPQRTPFPKELGMESNIEKWEEEFDLKPLTMGQFLAEQISRRLQAILAQDERVHNTFRDFKMELRYDRDVQPALFRLTLVLALADAQAPAGEELFKHEDVHYLLNIIFTEIAKVTHAYRFEDYGAIQLALDKGEGVRLVSPADLELFRNKKKQVQDLLTEPVPAAEPEPISVS